MRSDSIFADQLDCSCVVSP